MKKLLILLTAFTLFATACKNDKKTSNTRENSTNNDDYRNDNRDNDSRNNDSRDDNSSRDNDANNSRNDDSRNDDTRTNTSSSSSSWSSGDVNTFVTSCVNSAVSGGMQRTTAQNYCECMQVKLEKLYPNPNDAGSIDMESASMKKMVQDCLYN